MVMRKGEAASCGRSLCVGRPGLRWREGVSFLLWQLISRVALCINVASFYLCFLVFEMGALVFYEALWNIQSTCVDLIILL